jgi:hypothetical protein
VLKQADTAPGGSDSACNEKTHAKNDFSETVKRDNGIVDEGLDSEETKCSIEDGKEACDARECLNEESDVSS